MGSPRLKNKAQRKFELMGSTIPEHEISLEPNKIDSGSSAKVFKGLWKNAPVAVKKIEVKCDYDTKQAEREAYAMLTLSKHPAPNIIKFRGYTLTSSTFNIVMDYASGGNLHNFLTSEPPPTWPTRARLGKEMLQGIIFLHEHKIIHRDIKSFNLLLAEDGSLRIADFGEAREASACKAEWVGTPQWMPPEVGNNQPHTEKSDVYSATIVIVELTILDIPFKHEKPFALMTKIANGARPSLPVNCPTQVKQLITFGWAQDPEKRPNARELHDQFAAIDFEARSFKL